MLFSPLNLEQKLIHERTRQHKLMDEVYDLLEENIKADEKILERLHSTETEKELHIRIDEADRTKIFSLGEIEKICIRYRLRFLDSSFYKHEFPQQAVSEIKLFEHKYGVTIKNFKLIAPEHAFNLENINKDPLLFAQLTDNSFFLIHKWGKEMQWYRKFIYLPLQTPVIYFLSLLVACALVALSFPSAWLNVVMNFTGEVYLRIWFTLHLFIMFTGLSIWAGMAFDKNFSCNIWDSKYYNW